MSEQEGAAASPLHEDLGTGDFEDPAVEQIIDEYFGAALLELADRNSRSYRRASSPIRYIDSVAGFAARRAARLVRRQEQYARRLRHWVTTWHFLTIVSLVEISSRLPVSDLEARYRPVLSRLPELPVERLRQHLEPLTGFLHETVFTWYPALHFVGQPLVASVCAGVFGTCVIVLRRYAFVRGGRVVAVTLTGVVGKAAVPLYLLHLIEAGLPVLDAGFNRWTGLGVSVWAILLGVAFRIVAGRRG